MKRFLLQVLFPALAALPLSGRTHDDGSLLFDDGWRFHRGGTLGAEAADFDDSAWREIDLPHDWSIENIPGTDSPFDARAISQVGGGFTVGGTGWYRKSFDLAEKDSACRFELYFEGSYMLTTVWVNGREAGRHSCGYTSFGMDITPFLRFGGGNTVAVKVMNEGENSRWYSGSGLYRHVWLRRTNRIHIPRWGIAVTTPGAKAASARVSVQTLVKNDGPGHGDLILKTAVLDSKGRRKGFRETAVSIAPSGSAACGQEIQIPSPLLWSVETPSLYSLVSEVYRNGNLLDRVVTPFGIRSLSFSADRGFLLNGKPVELKGGCVHHDNGPLGSRAYDRAEERRIELLKSCGFNAVRCAHNPPSPAFLDACDRLGMLVIDEAFDMWTEGKNPFDYHLFFDECWEGDIESMVLRDRNHPCVIAWSIGNEIPGIDRPEIVEIARRLAAKVRELDPARPVTQAVNNLNEKMDPAFELLDIAGYNYAKDSYVPDHQRKPERIMLATESYPLESFEYWTGAADYAWVIGDFVWTAFDYLGEASIGWRGYWQKSDFFPWNTAYCGDIDMCGWKRPQSHYRDALWKPEQISLFVNPPVPTFAFNPGKMDWSKWEWQDAAADWNWEGYGGKPLNVQVYSSFDEVELSLNGRSMGRKPAGRAGRFMAEWKVPYEPGLLKATGYKSGEARGSAVLATAGPPVKIRLTADRTVLNADNQDLSYVTVELLDHQEIRHPKAERKLDFGLEGPASIVGAGNANPVSLESFHMPWRKAWQGRCLIVVKAGKNPGKAVLKVSSAGLPQEALNIEIR